MPAPLLFRNPWIRWAVILGGWTLLSVVLAPEVYLYFLYKGEPISWVHTALLTAANTGIAALFVPAIVWLTHRFPFERRVWARSLLVHVPACFAFSISHSFLYAGLCYASPTVFHIMFLRFHPNLITYWAVAGFAQALTWFERAQERERQLARAQLELLRQQLHPHFLFNTLHAVSAMMHEDLKGADQMISRLSDLLRLALSHIGRHEVPLREELEFVEKYLEIERVRFQERLALKLQIEPETLDALVPSMILQPLVENSIRHGFGLNRAAGAIVIRAGRREGRLLLHIADNGRGFPPGRQRGGLGLENIRKRLEQLYSRRQVFQLDNASGGGAIVSIEIPFHTASGFEQPVYSEIASHEDPGVDRGRRAVGAQADRYAAQS